MLTPMQGFRTFTVGLALAVAPSAISYLSGVDWSRYIGPTGAFFISGMLMLAMRSITSTPPGSKPSPAKS